MKLWPAVLQSLGHKPDASLTRSSVGGGCIDAAWEIQVNSSKYFVKTSSSRNALTMFEAEADGLNELRNTTQIRTPDVLSIGEHAGSYWIALEFIDLKAPSNETQAELGKALALMHDKEQPYFGWHRENRIGGTLQCNQHTDNWLDFYLEYRLKPQIKQLHYHQSSLGINVLGARLEEKLPEFFKGYIPKSSLLHGDLWFGNFSADELGQAVIFDPACYYGDRETDIAMTELFSGFTDVFYQAYESVLPLDPGYKQRKELYQLYHILNHANLFGGQYGIQSHNLLTKLVA